MKRLDLPGGLHSGPGPWAEQVRRQFGPGVRLEHTPDAKGRIRLSTLPPCEVLDITGEAVGVWSSVDPFGPGQRVAVMAQLEGHGIVEHGGRRWELAPGRLMLLDIAAASHLSMCTAFHQVALVVPRVALDRVGEPKIGSMDNRGHPIDRLLFEALVELSRTTLDVDQISLATAALGLLRGSSIFARGEPTRPRPNVRLRRAMLYIEAHFAEPQLCPQQVAAAQRVSRRWLDRAFASTGTTLAAVIQERRVQAAADLLVARPELSILAVALACGFTSHSALSHAFRRRFGEPPSAWRERSVC